MNHPSNNIRRLYRSSSDRMVAGIAGGLAEYFGVDTAWIRLLIVILGTISLGTLLIVYLAAWLIIPQNPSSPYRPQSIHRSREQRMIAGICGGMAETWQIDPTLVRLGMAAAIFFTGGLMIPLYLAAWIIIPLGAPERVLPGRGPGPEQLADIPADKVDP